MKSTLSAVICCLLVVQSYAFDLPYNRLKKSYEKDPEQCLEKSERWMKFLPGNPAGYYFASIIHFEKAQEEETTRKKYNELSKSLKFARELEKLKVQSFLSRVEWDTLTPHINALINDVEADLEQEDLAALSKSLRKKADRFDWTEEEKQAHYTFTAIPTKEEKKIPESTFANGQYFGKPSGTEMIPSYNVASEKEMLALINAEREKQGMQPLVWEEKLAQAARYHAFDMGSQSYFDHDSHDRSDAGELQEVVGTFERIRSFYTDSFVNSENIAAGNEGADDTYSQWYHSKGHYDNMFNPNSKKVGIGVCHIPGSPFGYYWVFCTAL